MKKLIGLYFVIALMTFIFLAISVSQTPYFPWDLSFSRFIQKISFTPAIAVLTLLSNLGYGPVVDIWMGGLIILFALFNKRRESLALVFLAALESVFFFGLTKLINRPRPSSSLIHVVKHIGISGFPSGHVMLYTMVFGFLAYLSLKIRSKHLRLFLTVPCLLVIVSIGVARIYSGEHWPSDVLGAYLLGSLGLIVTVVFYEWSRRYFKR